MSPRAKAGPAEHAVTGNGSRRPPREETSGPVHRALAVLELLGAPGAPSSLGVVEIARQLGRDKSQVSRLLKLLADAGFVDREAGSLRYRIGTRLFSIGAAAVDRRLRDESDAAVEREAALLGERVEVCVRGGGHAMTISTAAPESELRAAGWVGRTTPLSSTAAGRALLFDHDVAAISRVVAAEGLARIGPAAPRSLDELLARVEDERRRGWSLARHEMDRGLIAVGAPVRGAAGAVVAAISVGGPESRIDPVLDDVRLAVMRSASELSAALGATTGPPPAARGVAEPRRRPNAALAPDPPRSPPAHLDPPAPRPAPEGAP